MQGAPVHWGALSVPWRPRCCRAVPSGPSRAWCWHLRVCVGRCPAGESISLGAAASGRRGQHSSTHADLLNTMTGACIIFQCCPLLGPATVESCAGCPVFGCFVCWAFGVTHVMRYGAARGLKRRAAVSSFCIILPRATTGPRIAKRAWRGKRERRWGTGCVQIDGCGKQGTSQALVRIKKSRRVSTEKFGWWGVRRLRHQMAHRLHYTAQRL